MPIVFHTTCSKLPLGGFEGTSIGFLPNYQTPIYYKLPVHRQGTRRGSNIWQGPPKKTRQGPRSQPTGVHRAAPDASSNRQDPQGTPGSAAFARPSQGSVLAFSPHPRVRQRLLNTSSTLIRTFCLDFVVILYDVISARPIARHILCMSCPRSLN